MLLAAEEVVRVAEPVTEAETVVDPERVVLPDAAAVLETDAEAGRLLTVLLDTMELDDGFGAVAARRVALYTESVAEEPQISPGAPLQVDEQKLSPSKVYGKSFPQKQVLPFCVPDKAKPLP